MQVYVGLSIRTKIYYSTLEQKLFRHASVRNGITVFSISSAFLTWQVQNIKV
jgi:hypothetical protein